MPALPRKPSLLLLLAAGLAGASALLGQTNNPWVLATTAPTNANWFSIAISATNSLMVAAVQGGGIYIATNSESIWNKTSAPNQNWYSVAAAADGKKLVAVVGFGGGVYTSTNSGTTWKKTGAPDINWASVASSFDGKKLAAAATGNWIYTSTNAGTNWHNNPGAPNTAWNTIATSADGNRLVAVVYGGGIYTSTNAGTLWKQQTNAPANALWSCVASSADGANLVAGIKGGGIYVSPDFGATWTLTTAADANWVTLASSETGSILLAGGDNGGIYVSTDFGDSWDDAGAPTANWYSVATSPHGSRFVGVAHGGGIYTWQRSLFQDESVDENTATDLFLTTDPLDGANFSFAIVSNPTNGVLSGLDPNNGVVTYTPGVNYTGSDFFSFSVYDGSFYTTGTVAITVTPGGDVSLSQDEIVDENMATEFFLSSDPLNGADLTYAIVSGPTNGGLSGLDPNSGVVTYTPGLNYTGSDFFSFSVYDGSFLLTRTVAITVVAGNDAPVADDQAITMLEEATTNLVLTATNVDSVGLIFEIATGPAHGRLSELIPDTGEVSYTPAANYRGADSFTFTVTDGALYTTGTVHLTITAATNWHSVAMSWPGDFKAVVDYGGGIYTVTNYGGAWAKTSAPDLNWVAVACSSNAAKMAAAAQGDGIYTSTNHGGTWEKTSAPDLNWVAMVSSSDGEKLAAAAQDDGIYTSTNAGSSWIKTSAPALTWSAMAGTSAGDRLGAAVYGGGIYFSTNAGENWTISFAPEPENWSCLASSFDGLQLIAGITGGGIYTSPDFGDTWIQTDLPETNWLAVASSGFSTTLAAGAGFGGGVYISTDSGDTWNQTSAPITDWHAIAALRDVVAVAYGGTIYNLEIPTGLQVYPYAFQTVIFPDGITFSWVNSDAASGFVLQQNPGLLTTNWTDVDITGDYSGAYEYDEGTMHIIIMPRPAANMFFRLHR